MDLQRARPWQDDAAAEDQLPNEDLCCGRLRDRCELVAGRWSRAQMRVWFINSAASGILPFSHIFAAVLIVR
jgi:hypothetical protein